MGIPERMGIVEFEKARAEGAVLVDVRLATSFGAAFLDGSLNVGTKESSASWLAMVAPPPATLLLIADHEEDVAVAARMFEAVGYTARGFLDGGVTEWAAAGGELSYLPQISAHSLQHVLGKYDDHVVLDVRSSDEIAETPPVPGARLVPLATLVAEGPPADLAKDRHISTMCRSGYRGNIAASYLKARGFTNVYNVIGGSMAWDALRKRT